MDFNSLMTIPLWVLLVIALAGVLVGEVGLILLLAGLDKILPRRGDKAIKAAPAPTPDPVPAPVSQMPSSPVPMTRPSTTKTEAWRVSVGKIKK